MISGGRGELGSLKKCHTRAGRKKIVTTHTWEKKKKLSELRKNICHNLPLKTCHVPIFTIFGNFFVLCATFNPFLV